MRTQRRLLLVLAGVAASAMVYQFSVISALTFMIGDSLILFSIFSGTFLFSMGLGAIAATRGETPESYFVVSQIGLAIAGFLALPIIFMVYATQSETQNIAAFLWILGISAELIFGILIGMQLPLLQRIFARRTGTDLNLSKILAFDYMGSFIGAAAFPLLLFPFLGIFKAVFLAAALNILLSAAAAYTFGFKNLKYLVSSLCLAIVIIFSFFKAPLFEKTIDEIIYEKN